MFGIHYEADNSRLYVVCAKHVTQTQLLDEFKVFGTAEVKLNCDVNGFSKVPFVHFYRPISRLFVFPFFLLRHSSFFFPSFLSSRPPFVFA